MRKLCVLFLLVMAIPAFAQFTSNVQGTVTDPKGAVIGGASVTLTNVDTNETQSFVTSKSGQYFFNRLSPGSYRVSVVAKGFKGANRDAQVTTSQTLGLDIELALGSSADSVTITAEDSHGLNPEETRVQYTLSAHEIEEFPLQNRATLGLLRVAPGATGIDEGAQNINVSRASAAESVNGRSNAGNIFLLDFIPINSELGGFSDTSYGAGSGSTVFVPHPDMISEIALESTTFSVENSAGTGLQTNITTKSGTNKFHGDGDYTYTGLPFSATGPLEIPITFRKQYVEGALGGPIWKDRTFFFGSYYNQQNSSPAGTATYYAPEFVTWAQQNYPASQNIAKGLAPFPATRAVNPITTRFGSGFEDCTQPASTLLLPCALPIVDQAQIGTVFSIGGAQYNFRLDQSLREGKDRIYVSFFRFDQISNSPKIQPGLDGATPSTGYYLAGNYTHTFSQRLLNLASFGQTRFHFDYGPTSHSLQQIDVPYFTGCFCAAGVVGNTLNTLSERQSYGRDSLSYIVGKHNLTFGFQGAFNNAVTDNTEDYSRPFFQATFSLSDYLNDLTDYELLYALSGTTGLPIANVFGAGGTRFGAYAQDSWKITPNLLLTYGLRWDDFGNPSTYGKNALPFANVFLPSGGSLPAQIAGASTKITSTVYSSSRNKNFLPRGAFAYDLPGRTQKTVLRGGVGLYEDDLNLNQISVNLPTQPPVRLTFNGLGQYSNPKAVTSYGNSLSYGAPGNPHPYGYTFPSISIYGYNSFGAPLAADGSIVVGDLNGTLRGLKPSKAIIYNLGLEQEMPHRLVAGIQYSGSYGYDNLIQTDANTYNGRLTLPTNTRYSTNFGQIKLFRNGGVSNYNALIGTVRQTVGTLTYQASYTFGKSLSTPIENFTDQQNIDTQYTLGAGDIRNRFSLSQIYEVPVHFNSYALKQALSGWSISNVIVAQSGTPFTVADTGSGNDANKDGINYDIPLYTGTQRGFSRSELRHAAYNAQPVAALNLANFVFPAATQTQGLQNAFVGAPYFSLDTGISKKILIPWYRGDTATLALRGEAANVLNRANFGNPSGTTNDGSLGRVTSAYQGRIIQIGGRFEF